MLVLSLRLAGSAMSECHGEVALSCREYADLQMATMRREVALMAEARDKATELAKVESTNAIALAKVESENAVKLARAELEGRIAGGKWSIMLAASGVGGGLSFIFWLLGKH